MATLDVDKQALPGGNVNAPSSGTYGEKKSLNDLKAALPQSEMAGPGAAAGPPPMLNGEPTAPLPARGGRPTAGAPGLPPALTAPSTMPQVPVSTPLDSTDPLSGMAPPVDNHFEGRLIALDILAQDPRVSPETREWAQLVRAVLIGGDPA